MIKETQMNEQSSSELTNAYARIIRPILSKAMKARGLRSYETEFHTASRLYTSLLKEYYEDNGNLVALSKELGVSYSGLRRRVYLSSDVDTSNGGKRSTATPDQTEAAVARVKRAKAVGTTQYHAQLATEYRENGISLGAIAKGLGIANSSPLYYAVQRHAKRTPDAAERTTWTAPAELNLDGANNT